MYKRRYRLHFAHSILVIEIKMKTFILCVVLFAVIGLNTAGVFRPRRISLPSGRCRQGISTGRRCRTSDQCPIGYCQPGRFGIGGMCCLPRRVFPDLPEPRCPPSPPDFVGTCVVGPNSCLSNLDCQIGSICCRRGCGKECVQVGGIIGGPRY